MTICDKIQSVGTNLQNKLNALGVSCTFGNTNGHTLYDLAQLINENNLNGVKDTKLTITASRPYLLTDETTDIIIELKNGLGVPLPNKEVQITDGINHYTGITDNQGRFTVYNLTITEDTIFTATYEETEATCLVEYCLFADFCTTDNNKQSEWYLDSSLGTYTYTNNGLLCTSTNNNNIWKFIARPNNNNYTTTPFKAIFEVTDITYAPSIWINLQGGSNSFLDLTSSNCQVGDIIEVELGTTGATWKINGETKKTVTYSGVTGYRLEISAYKTINTTYPNAIQLQFRNFRIKSIE